MIVDLPPGTGDELLSVAQLVPNTDGAVVVTTSQDVALSNVRKSIEFAKALHLPVIGIIENMNGFTCPHCSRQTDLFGSGGGLGAALDLNIPLLEKIPFDLETVKCGDYGTPCLSKPGSSLLKEPWEDLARKVEEIANRNQEGLNNERQERN